MTTVMDPNAASNQQTQEDQKQQHNPLMDALDGASTAIDVSDIAVAACRKGIEALTPKHRTGGDAGNTGFTTGGGEGATESFSTLPDCLPDSLDLADAADAGSGILDGIGSVIGGLFEGLGSF